jgi:hypothetical protein
LLDEVFRIADNHLEERRHFLHFDPLGERDLLDASHEQFRRHAGKLSVFFAHGLSLEAKARPAHDDRQQRAGTQYNAELGHRGFQ